MNRNHCTAMLIAFVASVNFCGCVPADFLGSVDFEIDLAALDANADKGGTIPPITDVTVTLSREGFSDIVESLTVNDGIASGRIDDLLEGYWHLEIDVFSGTTQLFVGESDVRILPGLVVRSTVLFDPVIVTPDTGSIEITVGLNPVPGFKVLDQIIDEVMFSTSRNEIYLYDASEKQVAVYDGATFNRTRDIALPEAPSSICLGVNEEEFILGYTSGQLYRLNMDTLTFSLAGDLLAEVYYMVGITPLIILAIVEGGRGDGTFKTFDLDTGQIIDTADSSYSFQDLVFNPAASTAYSYTTGVSPSDIHRVELSLPTGDIVEVDDTRYHGDYGFGSPLRIVADGTRVLASSGNMFTSANLEENDLVYAGNIGFRYKDLVADDEYSYLYLLNTGDRFDDPPAFPKLILMNQENFFVVGTVDLAGVPTYIRNAAEHIPVIVEYDGRYYGKSFSKADLGLSSEE